MLAHHSSCVPCCTTNPRHAREPLQVQRYADELARNEVAHVQLLRAALGDAAVPCPLIDIGPAFAAAANAAVGSELSPPYSPYFNDPWFLLGAFIFEDVGVTAYNGAATLITDKGILGAAASILAVEAYHGGSVRTVRCFASWHGVAGVILASNQLCIWCQRRRLRTAALL
jgi:Ferritin-like domain